jgi:co-chaperonin GroES (HSP10)
MIQPRGYTVLIKPDPIETEFKNEKIVIPEFVKDQQRVNIHKGKVLAIGNCAWHGLGDSSPWCKVGDKVIYAQFGGKFVYDKDEELVLIQDKDVMAIVGE